MFFQKLLRLVLGDDEPTCDPADDDAPLYEGAPPQLLTMLCPPEPTPL